MDKGYKDLHVWRESVLLVADVYALTRSFPAHERFALCDQMRRAAVSVPTNIAEGQAGHYRRGFLRHLYIAKGSLAELHTLVVIAEQVGYITLPLLEEFEQRISDLAKPLHALIEVVRAELRAFHGSAYADSAE
jgi:four helix bundle protein